MTLTSDQDHHDEHGDATLDVIALTEAALKDDEQGMETLLEGTLASAHLSHVLCTFAGVLAEELAERYGREDALKYLAHQRGHELEHDHEQADTSSPSYGPPPLDEGVDRIGYEVSEFRDRLAMALTMGLGGLQVALDASGGELAALTRAVERLGDILDKRLA